MEDPGTSRIGPRRVGRATCLGTKNSLAKLGDERGPQHPVRSSKLFEISVVKKLLQTQLYELLIDFGVFELKEL